MFLSFGNTRLNPHVGLLFVDFANPQRLRLNGTASLVSAADIDPPYPEAQFAVRVQIRELFPNCPRYIHKQGLSERSKFVPRENVTTPIPAWKLFDWAKDVLPEGDPARKQE